MSAIHGLQLVCHGLSSHAVEWMTFTRVGLLVSRILGLQMAQSKPYLSALGPKVAAILHTWSPGDKIDFKSSLLLLGFSLRSRMDSTGWGLLFGCPYHKSPTV